MVMQGLYIDDLRLVLILTLTFVLYYKHVGYEQ